MPQGALYHHLFETPFGFAAVVFTGNRKAVRRILLPGQTRKAVEALISPYSAAAPSPPPPVRQLCRNIQAYFTARRIDFTRELLDFGRLTELEQQVLRAVSRVGYGRTKTYAAIAEQVGRSGAYRFVGTTLAKNPFPVVIPCHRIIRADGSPGGFGGGIDLKKRMLEMEKPLNPL